MDIRIPNQTTTLMYVEVAAIVPPKHQAYIRSAGSKGADAYEEVVERGKALLYVEHSSPDNDDEALPENEALPLPHTPVQLICGIVRKLCGLNRMSVVVVHHSLLVIQEGTLDDIEFAPVRNVRYIGGSDVTEVGGSARVGGREFTHIELRDFEAVTTIQYEFLRESSSLVTIDLAPLSNVTVLEYSFLSMCSSLTTIDLSPLSNVTDVGWGFMAMCSSLTTIDLPPLCNATIDGSKLLSQCGSLTTVIGMSSLKHPLTGTVDHFIANCPSLTTIDLAPLRGVGSVGPDLLYNCSSLTSIDLTPLSAIALIDDGLLYGCRALTSIDLSPLTNVTSIYDWFLNHCSALTSIDLSPLSNVTSVGGYFLNDCTSLTSIDLGPLSNITQIEEEFLSGCTSLTTVDLSRLIRVVTVELYFMEGCKSLSAVNLGHLTQFDDATGNLPANILVRWHEE